MHLPAGRIARGQSGKRRRRKPAPEPLADATRRLTDLRTLWTHRFDPLDALLAELRTPEEP